MKKTKKSARRRPVSKKPRKKRTPPPQAAARALAPDLMTGNFPAAEELGRAMAALQSGRPQEALGICGQVLAATIRPT